MIEVTFPVDCDAYDTTLKIGKVVKEILTTLGSRSESTTSKT
jgi:hypothetical protein